MICTSFDDDEKIFEALCAGANGYMLKRTSPAELIRAIREMCEGGAPMSGLIARKVVSVFQVNDSGGWAGILCMQRKESPCPVYQTGKMKFCNNLLSDFL